MKTPREILLARHQAAEPGLDAIRQAVVSNLNHKDAQTQSLGAGFVAWFLRCLTTPWRELILPTQRLWTGLATVWVLLFLINFSQRENVSSVTGQPVHSPAVMVSAQVQQRWMTELLADRSVSPPDVDRPRNTAPRPRTEGGGGTAV